MGQRGGQAGSGMDREESERREREAQKKRRRQRQRQRQRQTERDGESEREAEGGGVENSGASQSPDRSQENRAGSPRLLGGQLPVSWRRSSLQPSRRLPASSPGARLLPRRCAAPSREPVPAVRARGCWAGAAGATWTSIRRSGGGWRRWARGDGAVAAPAP